MTMIRTVRVALVLFATAIGFSTSAAAQSNDEVFPFGFEWNFSTPGARANAMGRTFIGMADDATATISNPAGLVSLTRPQIYGEFKNTNLKVDRLAAVDSLYTGTTTEFTSQVRSLSFFSASAPISGRLAVGFTVHRFLDYHESFNLAPRGIPGNPTNGALRPVSGSSDFTGNTFAGTIAYAVNNNLRVGVTVGANQFKADSDARRNIIRFGNYPADRTALFDTGVLVNQSAIHDTQVAASAAVGVLYRVNDMVQVGFDYTRSPKFTTSENLSDASDTSFPGFPKPVQINVPDHFGVGVAVRPQPKLLIGADVVRTNYSSLSKNTTVIFFGANGVTGNEFSTPDVTDVHVGAEYNVYNMLDKNPVFVRGGVYTNRSHLVTFTGTSDANANSVLNAQYNLTPRKDETRGTAGAGIALGPHAQVDAAYVFGKEFVLSAAVRF